MNKGWHMGLRLMLGAMIAAVVVGGTAGLASAQDSSDPYVAPSPTVKAESAELQPAAPAAPGEVQSAQDVQGAQAGQGQQVASASAQQGPSTDVKGSNLAFTGSDVTIIAALGFAALIAGGLVLFTRRRTTSA